jgi:very-short-patch-repair endonuclease
MASVVERALAVLARQPIGKRYQSKYKQLATQLISTDQNISKFTAPELVLYLELLRLDLPVTHHFRIQSTYEIDIWLPCLEKAPAGIAVECDGAFWHSNPEVLKKDRRRDMDLAEWHIATLRFDTVVIEHNVDPCAIQIKECYEAIQTDPYVLTNDKFMQSIVRRSWRNRKNIGGTMG